MYSPEKTTARPPTTVAIIVRKRPRPSATRVNSPKTAPSDTRTSASSPAWGSSEIAAAPPPSAKATASACWRRGARSCSAQTTTAPSQGRRIGRMISHVSISGLSFQPRQLAHVQCLQLPPHLNRQRHADDGDDGVRDDDSDGQALAQVHLPAGLAGDEQPQ